MICRPARSLPEIDADIARAEAELRRLHCERRAVAEGWREALIAAFDEGRSIGDLADEHGLTYCRVQGILHRAGRTVRGRDSVRQRIRELRTSDNTREACECPSSARL